MYNAVTLLRNFSGLVGLFQPYDPAYSRLPTYLNRSDSGRYVQATHPLCTLENLYNAGPEFDKFIYDTWTGAIEYPTGSIVTSEGMLYRAVAPVDIFVGAPVVGTTADDFGQDTGKVWRRFDPFADWLDQLKGSAILELFADFVKLRKLENADRSLLESQKLFDGVGSTSDRIISAGRFVGFEITLSSQEGISAIISRIGLQLDAAKDITLYLYHSSVDEPLAEYPLSVTRPSTFNWQDVAGAIISHTNALHDTGGRFYLGYYESDLDAVQAIHRDYNFTTGPSVGCPGCSEWNYQAFNKWSKYVKIRPFYVSSADLKEERTLWDGGTVSYEVTENWGMNLHVTVACDLTDVFSTNKLLFADALAKKICLKLLAAIAYSSRINAVKEQIKALAMADILPNEKSNFAAEYRQDIEALTVDFSGMNSACMPCIGKRKITMGAV